MRECVVQAGESRKSGDRGEGVAWGAHGGEPGVCRILKTEAPERGASHILGCAGSVARAGRDA